MVQATLRLPQKAGEKFHWGNHSRTSTAYAIAEAARHHQGLTLAVTPDTIAAATLEQEIRFFLADQDQVQVLQLPDWETLPYDNFSPHQDIVSQRLACLYQLPRAQQLIMVIPVTTLLHRLAPRSFLESSSLILKTGEQFAIDERRQQFQQAGYYCTDTVYEHGEFAIRGALVDIFPMGSEHPFRIDLFDNEIESIRIFDPESQRSLKTIDQVNLLPGHEFPMDPDGRSRFKSRFRRLFDVNHRNCPLYQDIHSGLASPGIEYYLPLFFEHTATLFDYLPEHSCVVLEDGIETAAKQFLGEVDERYQSRKVDPLRPLLPPEQLFLRSEELFAYIKRHARVIVSPTPVESRAGRLNFTQPAIPDLTLNARLADPLAALRNYLKSDLNNGGRLIFVAESAGRRELLLEMLQEGQIRPAPQDCWQAFARSQQKLGITIGQLSQPLYLEADKLTLIPESLLLGKRVMQQRRRNAHGQQADQIIRNLTELRPGAPVVHIDHGVGRYCGLQTLNVEGLNEEFLTLEYADQARLYVPVSALQLISRYSGADDGQAPLHRLGSDQWSKARKKAAEQACDVAAELLDIYARRGARKGFACDPPDQQYLHFARSFTFEETPDQQQAIDAVIQDMQASTPMDRLVCGDVGFGKTEVAMRAAFIAVQSGRQVAILVPTTLLAQQHHDSFRDRFADWPVEIDVMSRFRTQKDITGLKARLAKGQIDILIGTHKLLQDDLSFQNLGLLIIDEEHRFGVRHKEKLKSLRAEVDILTLTATPIPRTLNMAMTGIRDLSIIATPPARRLSVKTFIREKNTALIREAITRELLRGGQVYYVHNEVQTIGRVAEELQTLVPEARIAIGHGQMRERELEQVMSDFYHKRFNILVCTTIIETGIDVPSANTMIINRADRFGLAQLHQLRGRVGRSHHQAYAYLLTPGARAMTADAVKRLDAISEAQDLGAGFMLASNDLEIRGAGELLGEEQSGQIQSVGFSLYTEMLEQAIAAIKKGEIPDPDKPLFHGTEIKLRLPALLPEDYIHDVHSRLILYKRIAATETQEQLKALQVELIDRFGLLPEPAKNLFRQTAIKLQAQAIGVLKLDAGQSQGRIEFCPQPNIDPRVIIQLIQSHPARYKLEGSTILKYSGAMETHEQRFKTVEDLLKQLAG